MIKATTNLFQLKVSCGLWIDSEYLSLMHTHNPNKDTVHWISVMKFRAGFFFYIYIYICKYSPKIYEDAAGEKWALSLMNTEHQNKIWNIMNKLSVRCRCCCHYLASSTHHMAGFRHHQIVVFFFVALWMFLCNLRILYKYNTPYTNSILYTLYTTICMVYGWYY